MRQLWEKIVSLGRQQFRSQGAGALIIAVGLWVAGHRDTERAIEVAVEFRNIPADLMVMDNRVDYVVLRVMGPRTLVSTLDADNLKLSLDLERRQIRRLELSAGGRRFQCSARRHRRAHHASGGSSAAGAGGQAHVAGVRAALRQTHGRGYRIAQTAARPENVSVQGPAEEVRRLAAVETVPVDVEESRGGIKRRVRLSNDGKPLIDRARTKWRWPSRSKKSRPAGNSSEVEVHAKDFKGAIHGRAPVGVFARCRS